MKSNNYSEDFKIVKEMFDILREDEIEDVSYESDTSDNESSRSENFTLTSDNDFFKERSSTIRNEIVKTNVVFKPINVDYTLGKFEWTMTLDGNLEAILLISNDEETGMYISSENYRVTEGNAKAIASLEGFFRETLKIEVSERLQNKDF